MEYCEGDTLRSIINEGNTSPEENWRIFREVLAGLHYCHSRGMIHRDLKPENIFIGEFRQAKLGDFGLATVVENRPELDPLGAVVGTPMYSSPEQKASLKYDQKADMYSLGVIFFEMWRKFDSMMQRSKELDRLKHLREFPSGFTVDENIQKLVFWLTEPAPEDRPTAKELLNSDFLPHAIDPELFNSFLRVAVNPENTEKTRLLTALFEKENDPAVEYTYNVPDKYLQPTAERRKTAVESFIRGKIHYKFRKLMQVTGFSEIEVPLLYPYFPEYTVREECLQFNAQETCFCLMDSGGIIVQLPNDITVPWIRMIARKNLTGTVKRYAIGNKYSGEGSVRQHPSELLEASIDICFNKEEFQGNSYFFEAEILKVSLSLMEKLLKNVVLQVYVSDCRILDVIFNDCSILMEIRPQVLEVLRKTHNRKWAKVQKALEALGVNFSVCGKLERYLRINGETDTVIETLRKSGLEAKKDLLRILENELKTLELCAKAFGVEAFVVDFSLVPESLVNYHSFFFEISHTQKVLKKLEKIVLVSGGRYDNILEHYAFPGAAAKLIGGVGSRFNLEYILNFYYSRGCEALLKGADVFLAVQPPSKDEQTHNLVGFLMKLLQSLWRAKISTLYNQKEMMPYEILDFCRQNRVRFSVVVKSETEYKFIEYTKGHGNQEVKNLDQVIELIQTRKRECKSRKIPLFYPQTVRFHRI